MGPGETQQAGHGQVTVVGAGVDLQQCPASACHAQSTVEEDEWNKLTLGGAGGGRSGTHFFVVKHQFPHEETSFR